MYCLSADFVLSRVKIVLFVLQENFKHKDYIDHQKDKVALTLARLARHVEVEKQQKEEKNRAFRVCFYFNQDLLTYRAIDNKGVKIFQKE